MKAFILMIAGVFAEIAVWTQIITPQERPAVYFLDVGQGDSQLLSLPQDVQVLVDAGPGSAALHELEEVLAPGDRYIDLVVITHAEKDHYGGLADVIRKYEIGAVLWNGRRPDSPGSDWQILEEEISRRRIPLLRVRRGDSLRIGEVSIRILSPDLKLLASGNLNDGSIVQKVSLGSSSVLLTGDAGFVTEKGLAADSLRADVLKIGHHGSKYSSDASFIRLVDPVISVIQVGSRNTYGHPASEVFARLLENASSSVFRTDRDGRIELRFETDGIRIFTELPGTGYN